MSESTDDGAVLLNEGVMIPIAGGGKRLLKLNNKILYQVEQQYGGIQQYLQVMRNGRWFETLSLLFALSWKIDQDDAIDLIDTSKMATYFKVVANGIGTALGAKIEEEPAEGEAQGQGQERPESPGVVSLPLQSSAATSLRGTSGTR